MNDRWVTDDNASLLTDLYELTMAQAYLHLDMMRPAVFDLFIRRYPSNRNYFLACGLDDVLGYLERLRFDGDAIDYLHQTEMFSDRFLSWLSEFRFTGDVDAVREGTVIFTDEPIVQVIAPIAQAQIVETFLLNQIHFQTAIASKASRIRVAARDRTVVDFGLRRAHGVDAGLRSARACWIAGVDATSNVLAGRAYDMPIAGTMAHSFIQAHRDEREAFADFAGVFPDTTLLVDTYDTLEGVDKVIDLARQLGDDFHVKAVRLDSGDLGELARRTRQLLDAEGLDHVTIFASGGLDEFEITELIGGGAPIDGFGVGSRLAVAEDAPSLDAVYKLSEFDGSPRMKLSTGKSNLPGRKQVFRIGTGDEMHDVIARYDESLDGRPLLERVMECGRRTDAGRRTLAQARQHAAKELARLPDRIRRLEPADPPYTVELSAGMQDDVARLRRELGSTAKRHEGSH